MIYPTVFLSVHLFLDLLTRHFAYYSSKLQLYLQVPTSSSKREIELICGMQFESIKVTINWRRRFGQRLRTRYRASICDNSEIISRCCKVLVNVHLSWQNAIVRKWSDSNLGSKTQISNRPVYSFFDRFQTSVSSVDVRAFAEAILDLFLRQLNVFLSAYSY